jgi:type IV pilus assembly protein PilM
MIERLLKAVQDAGLRPEGVDLAAFAMIRALGSASPAPVLHLAVGGVVNLAVVQAGQCVFTRVVGGGLEAIAVELAERKQLTLEHARAWLEHVGLETPLGDIEGDASIIEEARAVLLDGTRRIAGDVRNSLDFHNAATTTGASVSRVVLTGAAAGVAGFAEALAGELGLPVSVGTVEGLEGVNAGRLTVAAGLAVEEAPAS